MPRQPTNRPNTLNMTLLAGTNFVLHAAGWLEGGLVSSYEKFMIDQDQLGMMQKMAEGVDLSVDAQALDAIREVGPGSHYLGCAHTQANFQTAFYRSALADNNSFEQWEIEGEKRVEQRANALARSWLEHYERPPLDAAIDEALLDFIAKKKDSMPRRLHLKRARTSQGARRSGASSRLHPKGSLAPTLRQAGAETEMSGPVASSDVLNELRAALAPHGVFLRGTVSFADGEPAPVLTNGQAARTVVLIGNIGGSIWPAFERWREGLADRGRGQSAGSLVENGDHACGTATRRHRLFSV